MTGAMVVWSIMGRGTHFYQSTRRMGTWRLYDVSIPFTPGNSFLPSQFRIQSRKRKKCQSPSHRGTHFYDSIRKELYGDEVCQSPSHRGTHFYESGTESKATESGTVSIPFTPGNSFLHLGNTLKWCSIRCQSPSHRGTHFYGKYLWPT